MPATDYHASFLGRINIRRNQVIAMDGHHEQELQDLELFSKHVSERFTELLSQPDDVPSDAFLSISWLRKLLNVFLCCEAEFNAVLMKGNNESLQISKPPVDRLINELLDRSVKALDICNAVTNGLESVKHYQKLAEIVVSALEQKPIGDGQARRAKKALTSLITAMSIDDKECSPAKIPERSWSFSRRGVSRDRSPGHFKSVAKNWSAAKQIQAMACNLVPPRGAEASGLASPVYTMSVIMVFVMWALVAAIPCQERNGLLGTTHFPVPKQLNWAQSIFGLHEKIGEEWKKKEKKGTAGLLDEMQRIEKLGQNLMEFTDSFKFDGDTEQKAEEAAAHAAELGKTCRRMEEGLLHLQMQIREVFHRIVRTRTEFLHALDQAGKSSAPLV